MTGDFETCQRPIYELSNNLSREVESLRPGGSQLLHYTSLEAFYSIIESGRLRFTSSRSTNDPSEWTFGSALIKRALKELPDELPDAQAQLIRSALSMASASHFQAFIFCMSEAIEDEAEVGELSQWRLYGRNGRGVALVIDPAPSQLGGYGMIPRRVIYGEDGALALVKEQVRAFLDGLETLPPAAKEYAANSPMALHGYLSNVVFWLPSVMKHRAYRHEREVRFVRGDVGEWVGNPLHFYERSSIRRPGLELAFAARTGTYPNDYVVSPITRVIIGPSGDQAAIEDSLRYFLSAQKQSFDIRRSDIPYRAVD